MKRTIVAILLVAALLAPAFGQDVGTVDIGQGWINPNNPSTKLLPESLIAWISNGFFMEEIDTMARAPLLFGSHKGYSVFTAYGNYESWNGAGVAPVNPFVPGAYTVGSYQLGLAMPVPGFAAWRAGFLFGQNSSFAGDLTNGAQNDLTYLERSRTETVDLTPADGVVDYTTLTEYKATDKTTTDKTRVIAALSLGSMGVSLYTSIDNDSRTLGGSYDYTRTEGTTTDTTARTTSQSTYWGQSSIGKDLAGTEASGKAGLFPVDQSASFGAIGQLSLLGMPVTASLNFKTVAVGGNYETQVAQRRLQTQTYTQDASSAKVNTYEVLEGVDLSAGTDWDPTGMVALPAATTADYSTNLTAAIDLGESGKGAFFSGLGFAVDPTFALAENVSLKPRASVGYSLGFANEAKSEVKYGSYSLAQTGTTAATEWTYSERVSTESMDTVHDLKSQLGAALSLHSPDSRIELVSGFYALPYLSSTITTPKGGTTSIYRSYKNAAGIAMVAPANGTPLATAAASIGAGDVITGTSQYDSTTVTDGFSSTTIAGLQFAVPVAVKVSFFNKKLSLVGGLNASYDTSVSTVKSSTTSTTTTETLALTNGSAAVTYTLPITTANYVYPVETVSQSVATVPWAGTVGFMVRWAPNETVTIDMSGASVKAAIAQLDTMLALNTGIGVSALTNFLDTLALSVTFHF